MIPFNVTCQYGHFRANNQQLEECDVMYANNNITSKIFRFTITFKVQWHFLGLIFHKCAMFLIYTCSFICTCS